MEYVDMKTYYISKILNIC